MTNTLLRELDRFFSMRNPAMVHAEFVHSASVQNAFIRLSYLCPQCKHFEREEVITKVTVPTSEARDFYTNASRFVREAFPDLTLDEVETIISGLCKSCQDNIFEDD